MFFMFWFLVMMIYSIILCLYPNSRLAIFQVQFMDDEGLCGFILGIAMAFGITTLLFQKLVWEPLFLWLKKKYP